MRNLLFAFATIAALSAIDSQACDKCQPKCLPTCAPAPAWKEVECTVLVPEWKTEKKTIECVEYERKMVERKVTVCELQKKEEKKTRQVTTWERIPKSRDVVRTVCKPTWKEIEYTWIECVPEKSTMKGTRPVRKAVWKEVDHTYTVCVPHTEKKTGTRTVCKPEWKEVDEEYVVLVPHEETKTEKVWAWKCVPVTKTRKVCEDQGHWEEKKVKISGGCNPCAVTCCKPNPCVACQSKCEAWCTQRVWVPKIVEKDVEYTCNEWQKHEEDRETTVTVCKPETKTRKVKTCEWVTSEEKFEYEECVWKKEQKTEKRKVCDWVVSQEEYEYEVCNLKEVERKGTRKVCELVEEEVTCKVDYFECVPKTTTEEYTVCCWVKVPVEKTITECVCVPVTVKKEVEVQVCHMVEKTVTRKVPVCQSCQPCCK